MDFSSLEKRRYYCEQEVLLNRRLAPEMYLGVLPIKRKENRIEIAEETADAIDYAVWMRRMDETRQMDALLAEGKVGSGEIEMLADTISGFHNQAAVIPEGEDWFELYEEFADYSKNKLRHYKSSFFKATQSADVKSTKKPAKQITTIKSQKAAGKPQPKTLEARVARLEEQVDYLKSLRTETEEPETLFTNPKSLEVQVTRQEKEALFNPHAGEVRIHSVLRKYLPNMGR